MHTEQQGVSKETPSVSTASKEATVAILSCCSGEPQEQQQTVTPEDREPTGCWSIG